MQAGLTHGHLHALADDVREDTLPAHARGEVAVVILAAIHLLDKADDVRGAVGVVQLEPFAEELLQFVRKTYAGVADGVGAIAAGLLDDRFEVLLV